MNFDEILRVILEESGGAIGVALMGTDGIPICQQPEAPGEGENAGPDVSTIGVEFGRILGELAKAADAVGGGALSESVVCLANFTLVLRAVDEDLLLVLAMKPDGNLGKARYLIRRHLLSIRDQL